MDQPQLGLMDCGDGYRRADNGSFGKGPVAKTAAYTVKALETGTIFTNAGATGSITFTLPTPAAGMRFTFVKADVAAHFIVLQAPSGVSIGGRTSGQVYKNVTTADFGVCTLLGISSTEYAIVSEKGTWVNAAS
jgi:hypothetical protein